jgi:hypothetical protein
MDVHGAESLLTQTRINYCWVHQTVGHYENNGEHDLLDLCHCDSDMDGKDDEASCQRVQLENFLLNEVKYPAS